MKSYIAKKEEVDRKWLLIDADGKVLGRMAAEIATILMGKNKPVYTPHVDTGDFVIVVNADKVKITGKKAEQKSYEYYTGYPSGHRSVSYEEMKDKKPEKIVELAVKRMLPKSKMGANMLKKLKIFKGAEHGHTAQQPVKIEI